jgi:hypothetical protein
MSGAVRLFDARGLALLRTVGVVSLLSVLVWVVAEGESLGRERVEVPVMLESGAGSGWMMEPADGAGWSGRVFVELEGATSALPRVRDDLRSGVRLEPGEAGLPVEPGTHTVDLSVLLRTHPALAGRGVSIASMTPQSVPVVLERILSRELDVRVRLPQEAEASAVVAQPRRVRLIYPSAATTQVDHGVEVEAVLSAEQVASLQVGRATLRDVPLRLVPPLIGMPFVRLDPPVVSVIATIETRQDTVTMDAVPVQIQRPAFQADRWVVSVDPEDQLLQGVVVTGPSDLIAELRAGRLTVFATVVLTPDDLDAGITEKAVRFADLPTPLRFESPKSVVRLRIEPVAVVPPEG